MLASSRKVQREITVKLSLLQHFTTDKSYSLTSCWHMILSVSAPLKLSHSFLQKKKKEENADEGQERRAPCDREATLPRHRQPIRGRHLPGQHRLETLRNPRDCLRQRWAGELFENKRCEVVLSYQKRKDNYTHLKGQFSQKSLCTWDTRSTNWAERCPRKKFFFLNFFLSCSLVLLESDLIQYRLIGRSFSKDDASQLSQINSKNDSRADANGFIEQYINVIFLKAAKNDVIFFLFFLIPDFYMFWYLFLSTVIISTYWSLFFKNPIVCVWKYQSKSTVFQYWCSNVSDVLKQCVYIKMFDMMLVKHIYFQRFLTF